MRITHIATVVTLSVVAALSTPASGEAQVANGSTGIFSYRFPDFGTIGFGPTPFAVGDGVELDAIDFGNIRWSIDLDAEAQTMTIFANDFGCCTNFVDFSGWYVEFDQPLLGAAGSVGLQSTNIANFGTDRITNTASTIAVSFGSGLDLQDNRFVVLQLSSASVPEPHAVALLVAGLLALGLRARRQERLTHGASR